MGSKVARCGELLFWDSTHNSTRYHFKLSTFTLVDSGGKSRAVLLSLNLHETTSDFIEMISCWRKAFNASLPKVVFTDDDHAFKSALSAFAESRNILHLMCTYHLFDVNVKHKVGGLLGLKGDDSPWSQFRKGLAACREAACEQILENKWNKLLEKWLPESEKNFHNSRQYMIKHVCSKRERWATCNSKAALRWVALPPNAQNRGTPS